MPVHGRPQCEVEECPAESDYELTGHWTIFDWMDINVCRDHLRTGVKWLEHYYIDGRPMQGLTTRTYADW